MIQQTLEAEVVIAMIQMLNPYRTQRRSYNSNKSKVSWQMKCNRCRGNQQLKVRN